MKNVFPFVLSIIILGCGRSNPTPPEYLNTKKIDGIEYAEDDLRFIKLVTEIAMNGEQCYHPSYFKKMKKFYISEKYYSEDAKKCVFIVIAVSDRESMVNNSVVKYQYFVANCFLAKKEGASWSLLCDGATVSSDISYAGSEEFARERFIEHYSTTTDWPYAINDVRFFTSSFWSDSLVWKYAMIEE